MFFWHSGNSLAMCVPAADIFNPKLQTLYAQQPGRRVNAVHMGHWMM